MRYMYIIFVICSISCMHENNDTHSEIDRDIKPYVDSFEYEYGKSTGRLTIQFGETIDNVPGICYSEWRSIVINRGHWNSFNGLQREELIYHELGHCVLGIKGHINTMTEGCPDSIMHENIFNEWQSENCYAIDRAYYMDQLFNR